jgi:two-component system, LytTR family, response regulator
MKAVIVDDEMLARRELRRLLSEYAWLHILGEAANIEEALVQTHRLTPELLFLDIQMPGGSGFDLLDQLDYLPQVIFTTAYDQHAVRAFEVNALDYLLKPIEPERLAAALAKVGGTSAATPPRAAEVLERIFVRDGSRCWFVPLREVSLMSSEGNYVKLFWGTSRPMLARPLAVLEQRLEPGRFFRANRSQIINLDFVEAVEVATGGRLYVQLRGGPEVEVSRRQAQLFRRRTVP